MRRLDIITYAGALGGARIHARGLARTVRQWGHEATVLVGWRGYVTGQLEAARTAYEQRFQFEVMAGLTAAVYATVQSRTARLQRFA